MPKKETSPFRVKRVFTNAGSKYEVVKYELLGRRSYFGKVVRQYFTTAKAARAKGDELVEEQRLHGQRATPISDLERADAVQAIEMLRGVTDLVTAAKFFMKYGP